MLQNPLFIIGAVALAVGLVCKQTDKAHNYIIAAGAIVIAASFFVHVTPLKIGGKV